MLFVIVGLVSSVVLIVLVGSNTNNLIAAIWTFLFFGFVGICYEIERLTNKIEKEIIRYFLKSDSEKS